MPSAFVHASPVSLSNLYTSRGAFNDKKREKSYGSAECTCGYTRQSLSRISRKSSASSLESSSLQTWRATRGRACKHAGRPRRGRRRRRRVKEEEVRQEEISARLISHSVRDFRSTNLQDLGWIIRAQRERATYMLRTAGRKLTAAAAELPLRTRWQFVPACLELWQALLYLSGVDLRVVGSTQVCRAQLGHRDTTCRRPPPPPRHGSTSRTFLYVMYAKNHFHKRALLKPTSMGYIIKSRMHATYAESFLLEKQQQQQPSSHIILFRGYADEFARPRRGLECYRVYAGCCCLRQRGLTLSASI
ncbi:unnamed protein product [Trichogramma brassicae]|uniref:Uncharacterized protein n=1 Tax=Trichogramma brassicae TaxID=86971 RepID=A0A6H5IH26_9HYME|nr:unnamed protein product [Trichogramma brassicae]